MKLTRLRLFDFRNYETLDLTLDPGVNLILGENAQGKTKLIDRKKLSHAEDARADPLWSKLCRSERRRLFAGARPEHPCGPVFRQTPAAALLWRCEAEKRSSFARRSDDGAVLPGRPSGFKRRQPAAQEAA